jgi:hypothetical protein
MLLAWLGGYEYAARNPTSSPHQPDGYGLLAGWLASARPRPAGREHLARWRASVRVPCEGGFDDVREGGRGHAAGGLSSARATMRARTCNKMLAKSGVQGAIVV